MKKIASSVSPFLVLIFPVLLFVGFSFAIGKEVSQTSGALMPSYNFGTQTKTVINECPKSFIRLLLK